MEKFPEMEHDDPNAIRLAPGETGEIVWTFANAGDSASPASSRAATIPEWRASSAFQSDHPHQGK